MLDYSQNVKGFLFISVLALSNKVKDDFDLKCSSWDLVIAFGHIAISTTFQPVVQPCSAGTGNLRHPGPGHSLSEVADGQS